MSEYPIEERRQGKPAIRSKTHWLNAAVIAAGVGQLAVDNHLIPTDKVGWVIAGVGAVNMILRQYFTSQPLE